MDMREQEIQMNKNLHLVPCRWAHSGWKYVQKDPSDTNFFQNPNRVNNFGVNADRKRFASSNGAYGSGITKKREEETTYGRFFL